MVRASFALAGLRRQRNLCLVELLVMLDLTLNSSQFELQFLQLPLNGLLFDHELNYFVLQKVFNALSSINLLRLLDVLHWVAIAKVVVMWFG